jgi:hypothetical protein
MRIEVTQSDIHNGLQHTGWKCPIALAIRRAGCSTITVGADSLLVMQDTGNVASRIPLSKTVSRWIENFDSGAKCEPFAFDVPLEEYALPLTA